MARKRVLQRLSGLLTRIPKQVRATLGHALWADFVAHANACYEDACDEVAFLSAFPEPVLRCVVSPAPALQRVPTHLTRRPEKRESVRDARRAAPGPRAGLGRDVRHVGAGARGSTPARARHVGTTASTASCCTTSSSRCCKSKENHSLENLEFYWGFSAFCRCEPPR